MQARTRALEKSETVIPNLFRNQRKYMEEWKEYKIGDICSNITSGGTPKSTNPSFYNGTIPWLNTKEVNFNRIYSTEKYISQDGYDNSSAKWIPENSVIVAMYGATAGKVAITKINLTTNQACCNLTIDPNKADYNYVYYFLNNSYTHLSSLANGGAQQNLNANQIKEYPIKLPPIPTQQKIAAILSSLDDKIELNNKINENLEQQAQALFKSWFVDFEPFGGKMPDGWKVGKLSEIADYLNGLAMQKFRPLEGEEGLPVLKIKELRQGCYDESSELCSPSRIKPEYIIHDGDVIFSWSGSLLVDIWCGGTCGLNQHLFKVTSKTYEKWFYYLWTKHHLDRFIFLAADKATTMGHIKREELDKAEVIIPDDKTYSKLTMTLSPIIDTIINNRVENRRLSEIRDNLLPELMSGNINVEDITI